MPGIPTLFRLVDMANDKFKIADKDLGFAYLGAVGPSLGDFISNGDPGDGDNLPDPTVYWQVWNEIFALVFGYDPAEPKSDASLGPSLLEALKTIQSVLAQLREAVKPPRDLGKIEELHNSGQLTALEQAAKNLLRLAMLLSIDPSGFTGRIGGLIFSSMSMKPKAGNKAPHADELFVRELLHWRRPGTFLRLLLENAGSDARSKAYAYGYLAGYAGRVCGSPFINSIVGGPYRTQWWRHRWINNHVDAWVYGFYEEPRPSMDGDEPTPPYTDWTKNLCNANLHQKLARAMGQDNSFANLDPSSVMSILRGKRPLPAELKLPTAFSKYWFSALQDAYVDLTPRWIAGASEERRQIVLTYAFLRLWMVLWFQTGTGVAGLSCQAAVPAESPSCGSKPAWEPPPGSAIPAPTALPPPVARPETEHDLADTVSGIAAIFLGAALYLAGRGELGALAIGAGVKKLLEEDTDINWDKLACDVNFYGWYHYGFCDALHQALSRAGFSFPYASELGKVIVDHDGNEVSVGPDRLRSRSGFGDYPMRQPSTVPDMAAWLQYPSTGVEEPKTWAYLDVAYPDFFIDNASNALGPERSYAVSQVTTPINDRHLFKADLAKGIPLPTGNALENIRDLIDRKEQFTGAENDFPQWNLDADRGLYYWTWDFSELYDTAEIEAVD